MSGGPLARASVEIVADFGGRFDERVKRKLRSSVDDAADRVDHDDRLGRSGKRAGDSFGESMRRALAFQLATRLLQAATAPLKAILGSLGFSVIAAEAASATASLVSLAGSLVPVVGLAAALPGVLASGAAALGTVKVALLGVGDAFSAALGDDQEKFQEALDKLSPAAADAARELHALRPRLLRIKDAVQDAFFAPLAGALTDVGDALSGPMRRGMTDLAGALGSATSKLAGFVASADSVAALGTIFDNTRDSVDKLAPALAPVLGGLRDLATAASTLFPGWAAAAADLGEAFGQWASQAAATGQAVDWINDALDVVKTLGGLVSDLAGIFGSLFDAAEASGANALGVLGQVLDEVNQFFASAQGQSALLSIFTSLRRVGQALSPVFEALASGVADLAPAIADIATALGPGLATTITALADGLAATGPGLTNFAAALSEGLVAVAPALKPLGQALSDILTAVSPLLPLLGQLAAAVGESLAAALEAIAPGLADLARTLAETLAPVIGPLTAALVALFEALSPVIADVVSAFASALEEMAPYLPDIAVALGQMAVSFADILAQLTPLMPPLIRLFQELFSEGSLELILAIVQAGAGLALTLDSLARAIPIDTVITFINKLTAWAEKFNGLLPPINKLGRKLDQLKQWWEAAKIWIGIKISQILGFVQSLPLRAGVFLSQLRTRVSNWFHRTWNNAKRVTSNAIDRLVGFVSGLPGRAARAVSGLAGRLGGQASRAGRRLRSALSGQIDRAVGLVGGLPGRAASALGDLGSRLYSAGADLIGGFVSGIRDSIPDVSSVLSGVTSRLPSWKGPPERDRRILEPAGELLMAGLADGIESGVGRVRGLLSGFTTELDAPVLPAPPGAGGGGAVAGGGGPVFNGGDTHITLIVDGQPFRAIIRSEISESDRDLKTRLMAGVGS